MTIARTLARFGAAGVAVAGLALALPATAAAHVTVRPDVDTSGSYAKLTFRVPIGPDEFDEFAISVGPLPEAGDYALPVHQTYSDGEVVAWADEPDADRPAPVLSVATAAGGDDPGAAPEGHDDDGNTTTSGSDRLARGLGVGGLALGAIGLGVGGSILRRTRA